MCSIGATQRHEEMRAKAFLNGGAQLSLGKDKVLAAVQKTTALSLLNPLHEESVNWLEQPCRTWASPGRLLQPVLAGGKPQVVHNSLSWELLEKRHNVPPCGNRWKCGDRMKQKTSRHGISTGSFP